MEFERTAKRARANPDEAPIGSASAAAAAGSDAAAAHGVPSPGASAATSVVMAMAAGGSPFDALPDELVSRIIALASEHVGMEAGSMLFVGSTSITSQKLLELVQLSHVSRRELRLKFVSGIPAYIFPALHHFTRLEQLVISSMSVDWPRQNVQSVIGPYFQGSLQALATCNLQSLQIRCFPLTLETLQALAPLAPTLKRLRCGVMRDGALLPVMSAIASFHQLEQVTVDIHDADGRIIYPDASEAELEPLASLASLRAYAVTVSHLHLGHLSGMKLDYIHLITGEAADMSPLVSVAGGLRSASLIHFSNNEVHTAIFAASASKLHALEDLYLKASPPALSALGEQSLKQWGSLRTLSIRCNNSVDVIPGNFLKRLAADVPSLEKLTVGSPLPLDSAGGLAAVSHLKRLRRLTIKPEAAAAIGEEEREALRVLLLHTEIVYETS
eukprot:tig00020553_g10773.t1